MGKTNTKINTKINTRINANTTTKNHTNKITLPKGSYTIDGDGNLIIHGGIMSGRETGGMPASLCLDLSYGEFMEKTGGRSAERCTDDCGDPFGMDFSAFGADPEKMIRECAGTVYGYARVSTDHQDYQRQIDALLKLGIREEDIFKDKKSGKDFNREEFRKLMHVLQPGDCIVVVELDRFGRSMHEIRNHWFWITQQKHADIIVLDQPVLNTRLGAHGLGGFLADLILAVFSLMAEIERKLINKRMEAGIRRVRLAGRKLGRKLLEIPPLFWKIKRKFLGGLISQNMASQELGVDPKTFRSWMERTVGVSDAREWEALKAGIEEQEKEERIRQARIRYGETAAGQETAERRDETERQGAAERREASERRETATEQEIAVEQGTATEQGVTTGQKIAGSGANGNPAPNGGAKRESRSDNRKSKRRRTLGEAKKKTAPGRKPRPKSRRI